MRAGGLAVVADVIALQRERLDVGEALQLVRQARELVPSEVQNADALAVLKGGQLLGDRVGDVVRDLLPIELALAQLLRAGVACTSGSRSPAHAGRRPHDGLSWRMAGGRRCGAAARAEGARAGSRRVRGVHAILKDPKINK